MTEENLSADDVSAVDAPVGDVSLDQELSKQVEPQAQAAPQERMFTQDEVNRVAGDVRRKTTERFRNHQQETQLPQSGFDESKVRELVNAQIAEVSKSQQAAIEKQRIDEQATQIYRAIDVSAEAAKEKIPDFVEVMKSVSGFASTPGILSAVHTLDNSAEVLHYLAKNPSKIPALAALSSDPGMDEAAANELKGISDRLKQNDNAKKHPSAPNPIGQIETNVRDGLGDATPQSIADFRALPENRG